MRVCSARARAAIVVLALLAQHGSCSTQAQQHPHVQVNAQYTSHFIRRGGTVAVQQNAHSEMGMRATVGQSGIPTEDAARNRATDNAIDAQQRDNLDIMSDGTSTSGKGTGHRKLRATAASGHTLHHVHHAQHRGCHPDCSKRGNCNVAEGRCECPFGLTGEACEIVAFPACRTYNLTVEEAEAANVSLVITCAEDRRMNCECYKQCWDHYCPGNQCRVGRNPEDKCFSYVDLPPEQQVSVFPLSAWTNVSYHQGIFSTSGELELEDWEAHGSGAMVVHPAECPQACSDRGMCARLNDTVDGKLVFFHQCWCIYGYGGLACEMPDELACLADCSGRGTCVRGFCHCQPGYYGTGCLKEVSAQAAQQQEQQGQQEQGQEQQEGELGSRTHLKIYMYDLPWQVAFQDGYSPSWIMHDPIYTAFWLFTSRLARDGAVLVQRPHQANTFFVPALAYYYSSNIGDPTLHMQDVIRYIRQVHPHYNATGGTDHFYFSLNDRGACILNSTAADLWAPIKLVHFGAFSSNITTDLGLAPYIKGRQGYGCFQPGKDVVVAPHHQHLAALAGVTYSTDAGRKQFNAKREILLAFAGGIRYEEAEYSGGVRQQLHTMFKSKRTSLPGPEEGGPSVWKAKPGEILIHDGYTSWHDEWMRQAKFCLAPYGHGWGIRLSIVITAGCVPVIIQDHVFQPYEDLLPYDDFSIRLPAADVPRIREVLAAVSDKEWRRLHRGLKKAWPHFVWEPHAGGQAYEATLLSLRKRLGSRMAGLLTGSKR